MAYTYKQFQDALQEAGWDMDEYDMKLAAADPDAGMKILQAQKDYRNATTDDAKALAHAEAESVRSANPQYYSEQAMSGKTSFTGKNEKTIDTLRDDLYGSISQGFQYDRDSDPNYQAAKKEYTREAERSARDTLARASKNTNGLANSYAAMASQQAQDYQMSQFADKEAEFYDRAYEKYQNENAAKLQLMESLKDSDDVDYSRYLYTLEQEKAEKETAQAEAKSEIDAMLQAGSCPSQELVEASGYSAEYIKSMCKALGIPYISGDQPNVADIAGLDVAGVQRYLNAQGYSLRVDGIWGPATEAAYQAAFGAASGRQTYTGSRVGSGQRGNSSSNPAQSRGELSSLDYQQDEGIFTWNGKRYGSVNTMLQDMNNAGLTDEEENTLRKKIKMYTGLIV